MASAWSYVLVIIAGVVTSFVTRNLIAPHLIFNYIILQSPFAASFNAFLALAGTAILGGLIVGIFIGVSLGFLATSQPVIAAMRIGLGTVALTVLWWIAVLGMAGSTMLTQWVSMLVELSVLISSLCLVSHLTNRIACGFTLRSRMVIGWGGLLASLLICAVVLFILK
jgi:hypothetical protein